MQSRFKFATLVAGLAVVASACSPAAASPSAPASVAPPAPASVAPSTAPSPVGLTGKLTVWHSYGSSGGGAEFKAFSRILQGIQAANPGLQVDALDVPFSDIFKKFETESAAGGGPDLFIAPNDSLGSEVRGTFLAPLDGKIDATVANSSDVSVAASKVGGKLYEVPESLKAVAMEYDADKVKTPPTTLADLLAFVQGGGKVGMISGVYFDWGLYAAFGGKIFDDTGKCAATANSGVADAMQYVVDLRKAGAMVDSDYGKINDAFKSGKVDLIFNGNWTLGDYKAARPNLAVAPIPAGPGGNAAPLAGVDGWYINAASANQDLAIAFAQAMVSDSAQTIYVDVAGHVPASKNVKIIDPLVAAYATAINQGMARPQTAEMNNYWGNFSNAWDQVLLKGADPKAAVATACAAMDKANSK